MIKQIYMFHFLIFNSEKNGLNISFISYWKEVFQSNMFSRGRNSYLSGFGLAMDYVASEYVTSLSLE